MTETRRFLELLWPTAPVGYLVLWKLEGPQTGFFPLSAIEAIEKKVVEWVDPYFGVGLRAKVLAGQSSGREADILTWPGVWVDVDVASPVHKLPGLPETWEEACNAVESVLEPSLVVDTGHGLHVYCLLDKPFLGDRRDFKRILVAYQGRVRDALRGKHLDNTAKLQQILRLPGTQNRKMEPFQPVDIVYEGPRYSWEMLSETLHRGPGRPKKVVGVPVPEELKRRPGRPTQAEALVAAAPAESPPWVLEVRRRVPNLGKDESRQLAFKLLAGEPFAEEGQRNETCNRLVGVMVYLVFYVRPETTAQEIYDHFFRVSIDAMAKEADDPKNPALAEDKVVNQIERALGNAKRDSEERVKIHAKIAEGLRRTRVKTPRESGAHATPAANDGETSASDDEENQRMIIQLEDFFFVYSEGHYKTPVRRDALEVKLRDDVPQTLFYRPDPQTGLPKRKKLSEFLLEYCTVARKHFYDLTIDTSHYDPDDEAFYEASCPVRSELEPLYDPNIQEWLTLLGGAHAQKLIDWIATITRMERETSAVFLAGASGTGKTLLASGLARLWSKNGPTELEHISGSFNADLLRCPLVLADEEVDTRNTMRKLMRALGQTSRTVTRKYMSGATLHGSVRYMFLGNDENVLSLGDEGVGMNEMDALAGRIFYIPVTKDAKKFLVGLGGRGSGTKEWVQGDLIARHALWLSQNMRPDFKEGTRWLVEIEQTSMHQNLVTQGKTQELVLEWLAKFLTKPAKVVLDSGGVSFTNKRLLVNTTMITDNWEIYMSIPALTGARVGRSLWQFSTGKEGKFWILKHELIFQFAQRTQIGDVVEMHKTLEREWVGLKLVKS